ncbi:MAG: sulfite exporter TauE/SafE family protein [Sulfuriferula sp.]|nr:sulfite exporter TauE/SafE family protein [Sulfuriferula sp.]
MTYLPWYLALGLVSGFIAGLLGVGGGLILVPILVWLFALQGFDHAQIMLIALATSLAVISFTSISSVRAHHAHGVVNWEAVRRITPGILGGTFLGAWLANRLPGQFLHYFFVAFLFYAATQMLLNFKPAPQRELPGIAGLSVAGGVIGVVSSWVGIGGGSLSVPFMIWCNSKLHQAIATSAAIGFPIAIAGTLGYVSAGWHNAALPDYSAGYVYLPAFATIASTSILTAPLGARVAHRLPVAVLKRIFAILLYALGIKMAIGLM